MSLAICAACGLRFASDHSFDLHQVGSYSDVHPEWRRCLTQTELMAGYPIVRGQRTPWRLNAWNAWTHRGDGSPTVAVAGVRGPSRIDVDAFLVSPHPPAVHGPSQRRIEGTFRP